MIITRRQQTSWQKLSETSASHSNVIDTLTGSPHMRIICELGVNNSWSHLWLRSPTTSMFRFTDSNHLSLPHELGNTRIHSFLAKDAAEIVQNLRYVLHCDIISLTDEETLGANAFDVLHTLRNVTSPETRVVSFFMCLSSECSDINAKARGKLWNELIRAKVSLNFD